MQRNSFPDSPSVPVWIDEFRDVHEEPIARVAYLAVEATKPTEGGSLPLAGLSVPFIATGLTAALCQPSSSEPRFESPESLSTLVDRMERSEELSVETPDLWLPLFTLDSRSRKPQRGDVFRIGTTLLATAIRFRVGQTTFAEFIDRCRELPERAVYSEVETEAFKAWATDQIHGASAEYVNLESRGQVLDWKDSRQSREFAPRRPGENEE